MKLTAKYKGNHTTYGDNTRYLDISKISDFTNEKEKIYFGHQNILKLDDMILINEKISLKKYLIVLHWFERLIDGKIDKKYDEYYNMKTIKLKSDECHILIQLLKKRINENHIHKLHPYVQQLFDFFCCNRKKLSFVGILRNEFTKNFKELNELLLLGKHSWKKVNARGCVDVIDKGKLRRIFPNVEQYVMECNHHQVYEMDFKFHIVNV